MKRCAAWLEAALEYAGGTHTLQDVRDGILTGEFQLWPGKHSAIVTQVTDYPRRRVLNFFLAGGDIRELEVMSADIEHWAKFRGCQAVTLTGRKGWLRTFLPGRGWKETWTTMTKEI